MPTNLYGQNDNYDLEKSHVLPALIRKMLLGKYLMEGKMDAIRADLNKLPVEGVTGSDTETDILQILQKYGVGKQDNKVSVTLWGTGAPMREFLHVDDMADASVYLLMHYDAPDTLPSHVNAGCGEDQTIKELAGLVKQIVGFEGNIVWDETKPDGTPRKLLDVTRLFDMGWKPSVSLEAGIKRVVGNYVNK